MLHAAWQPELWCYRWYTGESALSTSDTFGEVTTVCGVWRVVKEELVPIVQLSIWPDFQAQCLVGEFCKLMEHSGSATVLWTSPVFTSNVSVTCVFMRASRLHCAVHWQSRPQSAFPIRLQEEWCLEESWVLWKVFMCSQLLWDQYF